MRRLLLVLLALLLVGCSKRTTRIYRAPTVKSVGIQEDAPWLTRFLRGTSNYNLRAAMVQPTSSFWAYKFELANPRVELDLAELYRDAWRLELWYAHHGFFDAEFVAWDVRPHRTYLRSRLTPSVVVIGRVHEGEPSLVRSIVLDGVDDGLQPIVNLALKNAPLQEGARFDLVAYESTADDIRRALAARAYGKVQVAPSVVVHPTELAVDVTYAVTLGPACRFGPITVTGHEHVPEGLIQDEITLREGAKYSSDALAETQIRLFGLGVFSLVKVRPDLALDGDVIPVVIELSEATFHEIRVGTGVGFESGEQLGQVSARYTNSNVKYRLWTFEAEAAAGYKTFSSRIVPVREDLSTNNAGLFALTEASLVMPRFPRRNLEPRIGATGEVGRDQISTFLRGELGPALTWRFRPRHSVTVGYHIERWTGVLDDAIEDAEVISADVDLYNAKTTSAEAWFLDQLGIVGGGSYNLTYFDLQYLWRSTKDLTSPRNGEYVSVGATMAGLPTGFSFWRTQADLRLYRSLLPLVPRRFRSVRQILERYRPVFAARVGGGYARTYHLDWGPLADNQPYVHPNYRFTLGGSNDVRGWASNQLGPKACAFTTGPEGGSLVQPKICVPTGGELYMVASLELRFTVVGDFGVAVFNDWGMSWVDPGVVGGQLPPQPTVGAGLRYATPIGPIRLDFGWRIPMGATARDVDDVTYRFPDEQRWAVHFALTEAF